MKNEFEIFQCKKHTSHFQEGLGSSVGFSEIFFLFLLHVSQIILCTCANIPCVEFFGTSLLFLACVKITKFILALARPYFLCSVFIFIYFHNKYFQPATSTISHLPSLVLLPPRSIHFHSHF